MPWIGELCSILAAMTWALGVITYKRLGESLSPLALNLMKNCLVMAMLLPTVWLAHGSLWPNMSTQALFITVLSGALGISIADTMYFRSLNELGAGRMGIIGNLFSPSVIFLAYMFLGERLTVLQMTGFLFVLFGVYMVNRRRADAPGKVSRKGVLLGVGAILLSAVGIVMVKPVLETEPFFQVAMVRMLGAIMFMIVLVPVLGQRVVWPSWGAIPWRILWLGAFLGQYLSMLLWLAGYKYIEASVASILNETASIFILIFAWLLLGETLDRRKLIGVALTFLGVFIMIFA